MPSEVRTLTSDELRPDDVRDLRDLFTAAWGADPEAFTDDDWEHAVGGVHFLVQVDGAIVAHGSVVERELSTNDLRLATGYVEAVATRREHQGRGHASALMREVGAYIDRTFELGALSTGRVEFYRRLGWMAWQGPTFVRKDSALIRTEEEDGSILVRLTPRTPELDLMAPITCDWRPGDVW